MQLVSAYYELAACSANMRNRQTLITRLQKGVKAAMAMATAMEAAKNIYNSFN